MPTTNVSGRDAAMRRISLTSRWLLGGGLVLTGGLAALFSMHVQSGSAKPQVSTPAVAETVPAPAAPSSGGAVRPVPVTPSPVPVSPVQNVPAVRPHTTSRGS